MFQDMPRDFYIKKIKKSKNINKIKCEPHVHTFN